MQIEKKEIKSLLAYKKNQKRHSKKQIKLIAESIKEFGFINPVIIDSKNEIIAGHARVEAAKEIGISEVPVLRVDHLTDEQIKAYRIADNKLAELGEWDFEFLQEEIQSLAEIDINILGFSDKEMQELIDMSVPELNDFDGNEKKDTKKLCCPKCGFIWEK